LKEKPETRSRQAKPLWGTPAECHLSRTRSRQWDNDHTLRKKRGRRGETKGHQHRAPRAKPRCSTKTRRKKGEGMGKRPGQNHWGTQMRETGQRKTRVRPNGLRREFLTGAKRFVSFKRLGIGFRPKRMPTPRPLGGEICNSTLGIAVKSPCGGRGGVFSCWGKKFLRNRSNKTGPADPGTCLKGSTNYSKGRDEPL